MISLPVPVLNVGVLLSELVSRLSYSPRNTLSPNYLAFELLSELGAFTEWRPGYTR